MNSYGDEEVIIGALVMGKDRARLYDVTLQKGSMLSGKMFADSRNGVLYDTVRMLYDSGDTPTMDNVIDSLTTRGTLREAGGTDYLADIMLSYSLDGGDTCKAVQAVRNAYAARLSSARSLRRRLEDDDDEEEAEGRLFQTAEEDSERAEMIEKVIIDMRSMMEGVRKDPAKAAGALDRQRRKMRIKARRVAAAAKGKTGKLIIMPADCDGYDGVALADCLANDMDIAVTMVSLSKTTKDMLNRTFLYLLVKACAKEDVTLGHLAEEWDTAAVDDDEDGLLDRLLSHAGELFGATLYFADSEMTPLLGVIGPLAGILAHMHKMQESKIIVIDRLEKIVSGTKMSDSEHRRVVTGMLEAVAQRLGVVIVLLSQPEKAK